MKTSKISELSSTQRLLEVYDKMCERLEYFYDASMPKIKLTPRSPRYVKADPRSEQLKTKDKMIELPVQAFNEERGVFYFEKITHPLVHQAIQSNYHKINKYLYHRRYTFIYFSHIPASSFKGISELLRYYYPQVFTPDTDYMELYHQLKDPMVFANMLQLEDVEGPCFIRQTGEEKDGRYCYEIYQLPEGPLEDIEDAILYYIEYVKYPSTQGPHFNLSKKTRDELYPIDLDPDCAYTDLDFELKNKIEAELMKNHHNGALKILLFLIENLKDQQSNIPEILRPILSQLRQKQLYQPSRLVISSTGRLFLLDYNREVELSPIHRAVYILFLLHEDGILFKDLPLYRDDLMRIYTKISNRSSMDTMRKTIEDLVNPYNNAMSEKCSRIKEILIKTMKVEYARHYIIQGDRKLPKKIPLDRKYIIWEDSFQ